MSILAGFSEKTISPDPFVQFATWYDEHLDSGALIPDIVYLATSSSDCRVSLRTVLLKEYSQAGFVFFTNYESKKGKQLASNKSAALLFYWPEKNRQVRIEGKAERISPILSEKYFHTRPRESQLAAWASNQSTIIPGREYLLEKYEDYRRKFEGQPVPKPDHWGGFNIVPDWFEFWEDKPNRLHDRLCYSKKEDSWVINRLAP